MYYNRNSVVDVNNYRVLKSNGAKSNHSLKLEAKWMRNQFELKHKIMPDQEYLSLDKTSLKENQKLLSISKIYVK